jgi:hypothetical protein
MLPQNPLTSSDVQTTMTTVVLLYCTVIWIVVSYSYVLYSTIPGHVYRIAHMVQYSTVLFPTLLYYS